MKINLIVFVYKILEVFIIFPIVTLRLLVTKNVKNRDVLHISYPVHIAKNTVEILRENGVNVDYLAIGKRLEVNSDFQFQPSKNPALRVFQEISYFFGVLVKYKNIHSHFFLTPSVLGWEFFFLKRLGTNIVTHSRGCNSRDWRLNYKINSKPEHNICFNCDYDRTACDSRIIKVKKERGIKYSSKRIVTTPDLMDFVPGSMHMPFFSPLERVESNKAFKAGDLLRVTHVTNHPGIEGTEVIKEIIDEINREKIRIELVCLKNVSQNEYFNSLKKSHISIGKMKMGYYANAQIESLSFQVPVITFVRDSFMNSSLEDTAFFLTDLSGLKQTLLDILKSPEVLTKKKKLCFDTISKLHGNKKLAEEYKKLYILE